MHSPAQHRVAIVVLCLSFFVLISRALAQSLTVQVGSPAPPPTPLVNHGDTWSWHKGTNAPQASWQTIDDATLDATWSSSAGGFGYGDAGIVGEATTLSDMLNRYTTFFIRRTFTIGTQVDTTRHLMLTVDYDDAFLAYLDGVEIHRANTTNAAGSTITYTQTAGGNSHEASCCNAPVNPAATYDLGAVGSRLGVGPHILALVGLNQSVGSSDFHLIADLALSSSAGTASGGPILALVPTNSVALTGSNTVAGSTRVTVNGDDAVYDAVNHTWSKTNSLAPGVNKLFIAALDNAGNLLASTNRLIISELSSTAIGGTLSANTTLGPGIVHVTSTAVVPAGGTLTIQPGTVMMMTPVSSILATNATLMATGTASSPIYFLPADGSTTNWGEIAISGTTGTMLLQHIETIAGHVEVFDGAVGTLEDSFFHDYWTASPAIIHTLGQPNHVTLNMRRCHVARYQEVLSQIATNHIEDCLL